MHILSSLPLIASIHCCHGYHRGPLLLLCPPSPPPPNHSLIPPASLPSPLTPSLSPTTPTFSFLPPSPSPSPIHLFNTHLQWSWWVKLALHLSQKTRSYASCHGDEGGKSLRQYWDQTSHLTFCVAKKVAVARSWLYSQYHISLGPFQNMPLTYLSDTLPHFNTPHTYLSDTLPHFNTPHTYLSGTCVVASRKRRGGLYAGSDILSREYAPSSGATPRCYVLYYRPIEADDLPSLLILSSPKPQKLDGQDQQTEVGHSIDSGVFQAFRWFVLSMCCC